MPPKHINFGGKRLLCSTITSLKTKVVGKFFLLVKGNEVMKTWLTLRMFQNHLTCIPIIKGGAKILT